MRILIVEDEEKVASFIRKGLEQMAYSVDTAGTGEEALGLALVTRYDAIVLDVMLPGRDGLSVVRELRARGSDVPVLALTARGTLEDRVAGLDSGCDDYLPKPFAFEELLARLRALLRRGSAASALPATSTSQPLCSSPRRMTSATGASSSITRILMALVSVGL